MTNQKKDFEKFFTITTPRKDGSILDQFLDEFGYSAFEKEDRSDDTRRSVQQITPNEELVSEVSDFCNENKCKMQLIYKRGNQLVQQTFQSNQAYSPKPYGESEGQKLQEIAPKVETQNVEQQIPDNSLDIFLTGKENQLKNQPSRHDRNKKPTNNKPQHNKPQHNKPQHNKPQHNKPSVKSTPVNNKPTTSKSSESNSNKKVPNNKANENNPNHPSYKGKKIEKSNDTKPSNSSNAKPKAKPKAKPRQQARRKPAHRVEAPLKQVSESPVAKKPQDVADVTVIRKKKRTISLK